MGWGDCGTDSKGRPIGYRHSATCDYPGCSKKIHRGLAYACGGMHGDGNIYNDDFGCEGYFCYEHLLIQTVDTEGRSTQICAKCYAASKEELNKLEELQDEEES